MTNQLYIVSLSVHDCTFISEWQKSFLLLSHLAVVTVRW